MAMTGVDVLFVDTNILVYATNLGSAWRQQAIQALDAARLAGVELVISQQVLREYLTVALQARAADPLLTLEIILENFNEFRREFRVVGDTPDVMVELERLLRAIPIGGKLVHDTNIVATMVVHGVRHLLTHNVADFNRFSAHITIIPLDSL